MPLIADSQDMINYICMCERAAVKEKNGLLKPNNHVYLCLGLLYKALFYVNMKEKEMIYRDTKCNSHDLFAV